MGFLFCATRAEGSENVLFPFNEDAGLYLNGFTLRDRDWVAVLDYWKQAKILDFDSLSPNRVFVSFSMNVYFSIRHA